MGSHLSAWVVRTSDMKVIADQNTSEYWLPFYSTRKTLMLTGLRRPHHRHRRSNRIAKRVMKKVASRTTLAAPLVLMKESTQEELHCRPRLLSISQRTMATDDEL